MQTEICNAEKHVDVDAKLYIDACVFLHLGKDLPGFSLEQILKKLGRQFKIKEDGDGFQVALAKVEWDSARPALHRHDHRRDWIRH